MNNLTTIAGRQFRSYFNRPIAYIVICVFLCSVSTGEELCASLLIPNKSSMELFVVVEAEDAAIFFTSEASARLCTKTEVEEEGGAGVLVKAASSSMKVSF